MYMTRYSFPDRQAASGGMSEAKTQVDDEDDDHESDEDGENVGEEDPTFNQNENKENAPFNRRLSTTTDKALYSHVWKLDCLLAVW